MSPTSTAARSKLLPLLVDLNELKRVRPAPSGRSLAAHSFLRSWAALRAGADPVELARLELGTALVASRLAGADVALLVGAGLAERDAADVCADARRTALERASPWAGALADAVGDGGVNPNPLPGTTSGGPPDFARLLAVQPRAPATKADRPRISVEPAENHADHCGAVAAAATVIAVVEGADPGVVLLAALSHHLHNARLPDGGFAGEVALGAHLPVVIDHLRRQALSELPAELAGGVVDAAERTIDDTTPEGRALHAADVVDRVLQTHHHARLGAFTVEQARHEYSLVHEGPLHGFHQRVLAEIGL